MKCIPVILFGAILAFASVAAAKHSAPSHPSFGPPTPLCPPDSTDCDLGGPR
jgi:hypothetical protein